MSCSVSHLAQIRGYKIYRELKRMIGTSWDDLIIEQETGILKKIRLKAAEKHTKNEKALTFLAL